jgi:hypothetical protein
MALHCTGPACGSIETLKLEAAQCSETSIIIYICMLYHVGDCLNIRDLLTFQSPQCIKYLLNYG